MISGWLAGYRPLGETEAADVARMRGLAAAEPDPWTRSLPLHFTASALVVHPASGRVLLRWHQRQRMWLEAGGHADPGESDPLAIALREAAEETGLPDLVPWPDRGIKHAVVCDVAPGKGEPAHEHADLRFFMATAHPDAARPENPDAPLRWLTVPQALDLVGANNLRHTLDRVRSLLSLSPLPPVRTGCRDTSTIRTFPSGAPDAARRVRTARRRPQGGWRDWRDDRDRVPVRGRVGSSHDPAFQPQ